MLFVTYNAEVAGINPNRFGNLVYKDLDEPTAKNDLNILQSRVENDVKNRFEGQTYVYSVTILFYKDRAEKATKSLASWMNQH